MYRGRYDKPTPPGYSGIAFAEKEEREAEKHLKNSPTPVKNGAGEDGIRPEAARLGNGWEESLQKDLSRAKTSDDRRHEIKTLPRDFSGTGQAAAVMSSAGQNGENEDRYATLSSLFQKKISLEELLLLGTALFFATKEEKSEAFAVFALALMLLDA